ncbi:LEPR-XLL domain-containing protein, partial [Arthrospira platensis SPKY1]|nr:LEPR-XLL domain-containing protein [Arthrospira platensis SPKY1]
YNRFWIQQMNVIRKNAPFGKPGMSSLLSRLLDARFRVEPLEMRILLSADPLLGGMQQQLMPRTPDEHAIHVQYLERMALSDLDQSTEGTRALTATISEPEVVAPAMFELDIAAIEVRGVVESLPL